ncbi:MAG: hypothetical protein KDB27_28610, partial [Planctomycetales bacterium]|nr:hypothetical protein [Planctomycetales bacterium]
MTRRNLRRASVNAWTVAWLLLICLIVVVGFRDWSGTVDADSNAAHSLVPLGSHEVEPREPVPPSADKYLVTIRRPSGPPSIELKNPDSLGRTGRVACSTCHSIREPNPDNRQPSDLKQFHQDMTLSHGQLTCYACHNPDDSNTLRLADGSAVEYANVMDLCSQCHGSQARSYERGFHGGMTGYWDLSR